MVRLDVRFDLNEFRRGLDRDGRKKVNRAAASALGRVATTVRKEASLTIRQRIAISSAAARKAIVIRRAGADRLTVFIEASGKPIPLRDFQARQGKRGVTYRVTKGGSRKQRQNKYGSAFIVDGIGKHVFIRVTDDPPGSRKANIRLAYGPSIPQYFVTRVVRQLMLSKARERWPIEFARAWRGISGR